MPWPSAAAAGAPGAGSRRAGFGWREAQPTLGGGGGPGESERGGGAAQSELSRDVAFAPLPLARPPARTPKATSARGG
jgi:hypothetical protein